MLVLMIANIKVGAPAAEHAEGGLGGEVEGDPTNKALEGEPASSGGEQPGDGSRGKGVCC